MNFILFILIGAIVLALLPFIFEALLVTFGFIMVGVVAFFRGIYLVLYYIAVCIFYLVMIALGNGRGSKLKQFLAKAFRI